MTDINHEKASIVIQYRQGKRPRNYVQNTGLLTNNLSPSKMYCPEFPNEKRTFTAKKYDTLLCIVTRAVQVEMSAYFRHFFFEIVIQRHSLHRTRCSCWMTPPGNQKKTVLYHIRCAGTSRSSASIHLYVS